LHRDGALQTNVSTAAVMPVAADGDAARGRSADLIVEHPAGLYCPPGDFYIDPWRPVDRAVITHAHADHARAGSNHYLATNDSARVLRSRLGAIALDTLAYGERVLHNGVAVSLHPAGHVLGSAQVRVEWRGQVWVASGDYKLDADPTCRPFDAVPCHVFISEATFGLPIYKWRPPAEVFSDIAQWWRGNAAAGVASVLYCYAFGKAQRILAGMRDAGAQDTGPLICHGAIEALNRAYHETGIDLPMARKVTEIDSSRVRQALVLAPPSAAGTPWLRRFGELSDGFASGWMQIRGARRRRALDRGFVLSDHADWPSLQSAIAATGATRVIITHGQTAVMVRWLTQQGLNAAAFDTEYDEEAAEGSAGPVSPSPS
jgi:putative mRNA 3-end processing factor